MLNSMERTNALAAAVLSLTIATAALAADLAGTFVYVGDSGVSAQQVSYFCA